MYRGVSVKQIQEDFGAYIMDILGNQDRVCMNFSSIENPMPNSLIWTTNKYIDERNLEINDFGVLLIDSLNSDSSLKDGTVVICNNPRLLFAKIIDKYFTGTIIREIHPSAIISPKAIIHNNVLIGPYCIVEDFVEIGSGCIIESNVHIYTNTKIGENVIIQSGAKIGTEVMSFVSDIDNSFVRFPTKGNVVIEENVEIGANVIIVRSAMDSTRIGSETKVNSGSYIGSSVQIGVKNYIAALVIINGSVKLGNDNFLGAGAVIKNKMIIGNNNTIGAGAVVVKDIDNRKVYTGNPAEKNDNAKRLKI